MKKLEYYLKPICISIGLIILLIIYQFIPIELLLIIGFNFQKLSINYKILYMFITNIIFIFFLIYIYKDTIKKDFNNFLKNKKSIIKMAIKYWLIGLFFMYISNYIIALFNKVTISENEKLLRELLNNYKLYMIFQTTIYAPITEELIFRKSIKDIFKNPKLSKVYILVSGLVFAGLHVISNNDISNLIFIIPYSTLGIAFAALYNKTDNIFSSTIAHCLHNAITTFLLIFARGL